jgi:hypothetical protein
MQFLQRYSELVSLLPRLPEPPVSFRLDTSLVRFFALDQFQALLPKLLLAWAICLVFLVLVLAF